MPDKAWKKRERDVANYFNGKRTPLSGGNGKVTRADVIHKDLFIECKLRAKHTAISLWDDTAKLAKEEGKNGVRANSIALGVIDTGIFHRLREENNTFFDDAWHEAVMNTLAIKRFGYPKEVADTAVFLASSRGGYITGHCIPVDGGYHL